MELKLSVTSTHKPGNKIVPVDVFFGHTNLPEYTISRMRGSEK